MIRGASYTCKYTYCICSSRSVYKYLLFTIEECNKQYVLYKCKYFKWGQKNMNTSLLSPARALKCVIYVQSVSSDHR